jgi:hypothetical protein
MTGHLNNEASAARLEDLRRRAEHRRTTRPLTSRRGGGRAMAAPQRAETTVAEPIAIRRATGADRIALARLAALASAETPDVRGC